MSESTSARVTRVSGRRARTAAVVFNIGNIVAIMVPIPLGMLWLGASMLVYAMNRHHPNEKVGHYTQQAAYRFYGITGFFVAAATFIPGGGWDYYLVAWGLAALILIPWSILDLVKIGRDHWEDIDITETPHAHGSH
ncbi:MAG TPA: hypothetical protein ENK12_10430 [Gammaproteobacteria bacterium]|nr:hypothetical protein [Gammaproteobacteria bacterium]